MDDETVKAVVAIAGSAATMKLLDVVRSGVGAIARAPLMLRDARAEVSRDEIKQRAAAFLEKQKLLDEAELGALQRTLAPPQLEAPSTPGAFMTVVDIADEAAPIPLVTRMYTRFVVQESKRQVNLEAVVQAAEEQLHATPDAEVSAEPVDETWKTRFFSAAQDVSDDEMRRLWGAVLAGEVKQPKSFSLRCLDVLRNLSPGEAQRFQRLLPIVTAEGVAVFGKAGRDVPLTFDERSSLADAGLIHADNGLVIQQLIVVPGEKFQSTVVFHDLALWVAHDSPSNNLEFPACVLTDAGRQLAKLTEVSADPRHLDLLKKLAVAKGFRATIHRVLRNLGSHWLVTKDEFDVDASGQLVPVAPIAAEANVASPAPDSSPA